MDADAQARRSAVGPSAHLPALGAYAVITVVLTWPVAVSPGAMVASDLGDPLLSAAILWWNAHRLPFSGAWWNGLFFFPGSNSLALSDHRVGLGLFATPMIWLGASALTAYGITFLLTWWLSAAAAYALVWTLTSSRAAAFVAGCVFGFNPFRAAHLAHLELLASYCLPVVLLAMHRWVDTRRVSWLFLLSAVLLLQALTSGYFFFFMMVFIALWLVWFARDLPRRELVYLAIALIAPVIAIMPVLLHFRHVHEIMGLSRSINEIEQFSADLIGLVTAPEPLALWDAPAAWRKPEGELLPGVVAVLLVVAGSVAGWRGTTTADGTARLIWLRRGLVGVGTAMIGIAILPLLIGPVAFTVGPTPVSISGSDKPLSIAFACAALWLATSRPFMAAFRTGSVFAFYGLAAAVMWLLALGPQGRLLGQPFLYKAPYAWLMLLPGFHDSFRAPARFALLAALALSVAAAVAVSRLGAGWRPRPRMALIAAIVAAILAESWIYPFPVVSAPAPLEMPAEVTASAVVLELPAGVYEDALATFHTTQHQRPSINGMSGYRPPHYAIFTTALAEEDASVVAVIRRYADVAVFSRRDSAEAAALAAQLRAAADATALPATATHDVTLLKRQPAPQSSTPARRAEELRPAAMATNAAPASLPLPLLDDNDYRTAWETRAAQTGSETITLTLAEGRSIAGVRLSLGPHAVSYPRGIAIDVSDDGERWTLVAAADGAVTALDAALQDPARVDMMIWFEPRRARHVRIRQTGQSLSQWSLAELRVLAEPVE